MEDEDQKEPRKNMEIQEVSELREQPNELKEQSTAVKKEMQMNVKNAHA